jgi:hypothetical protein
MPKAFCITSAVKATMLAEERYPEPPQRVGAGEHDFHLPARMLAGMVGERQLQHVLEIIGQHQIAALMREPVGEPRDQRAGPDDKETERDPSAGERRQRPRRRSDAGRQCARQRIDDATEQNRLGELRASQRDIGKGQRYRQPAVGAQQAKDAEVDSDKRHAGVLAAAAELGRVQSPDFSA